MPLKLQLTWVAKLKQWRKRHRGETYYLGTGKGKTDVESYRKAVAKWVAKKAELDAAEQKALTDQRLQDYSRKISEYGSFLAGCNSQSSPA